MSTKNKTSRDDVITADQKLIDGVQKNKAKLPASFPLEGETTTPDGVVAVLEDRIKTGKAAVAAEATRTAAVQADKTKRAQTNGTVLQFRHLLVAMFAKAPDVLGDFGLAVPAVPVKSAETKAAAAAKGKATRALLGTKGPKQKQEVLKNAATAPATAPEGAAQVPAQAAPAAAGTSPVAPQAAPVKPVS